MGDCPNDSVRHMRQENDRIFVFLAGVTKDLDEVRGRILDQKPLLSLREVFSEVRREEGQCRVMLRDHTTEEISLETEPSAGNEGYS